MAEEAKKKTGWRGPAGSINTAGRPKRDPEAERKTNREIRGDLLLKLCRKFSPHISKAILTAVEVMNDKEANAQNRLKASALIIATYNQLIKDTFDRNYDNEEADEIQEDSKAPVFSLRMIGNEEDTEKK